MRCENQKNMKPVEVQDGFLSQTFSPTHPSPSSHMRHISSPNLLCECWVFFNYFSSGSLSSLYASYQFKMPNSYLCDPFSNIYYFSTGQRWSNSDLRHFFSDGFVDSTTNKLWHWPSDMGYPPSSSFAWLPSLAEPGICRDTVTRNPQVGFRKIRVPEERCLRDMWRPPKIKQKKQTTKQCLLYSIWWNVCIYPFSFLIFKTSGNWVSDRSSTKNDGNGWKPRSFPSILNSRTCAISDFGRSRLPTWQSEQMVLMGFHRKPKGPVCSHFFRWWVALSPILMEGWKMAVFER